VSPWPGLSLLLSAGIASMVATPLALRVLPRFLAGEKALAPLERLLGLRDQVGVNLAAELMVRDDPDGERRACNRHRDRDRGEQHQPDPEAHGSSRRA